MARPLAPHRRPMREILFSKLPPQPFLPLERATGATPPPRWSARRETDRQADHSPSRGRNPQGRPPCAVTGEESARLPHGEGGGGDWLASSPPPRVAEPSRKNRTAIGREEGRVRMCDAEGRALNGAVEGVGGERRRRRLAGPGPRVQRSGAAGALARVSERGGAAAPGPARLRLPGRGASGELVPAGTGGRWAAPVAPRGGRCGGSSACAPRGRHLSSGGVGPARAALARSPREERLPARTALSLAGGAGPAQRRPPREAPRGPLRPGTPRRGRAAGLGAAAGGPGAAAGGAGAGAGARARPASPRLLKRRRRARPRPRCGVLAGAAGGGCAPLGSRDFAQLRRVWGWVFSVVFFPSCDPPVLQLTAPSGNPAVLWKSAGSSPCAF